MANQIRTDGLVDPDMIIMGDGSYEYFLQNSVVKDRLNFRRADTARIIPPDRMGSGGVFRGTIDVENYTYEIWTYSGRYKHPQTGVSTKYIPDNKVVVRASAGRLDATFGAIPRITTDSRVPPALTQRITVPGSMIDITMNAWITEDGETMWTQAGTRPLLIPTAIDTFGCLSTGI